MDHIEKLMEQQTGLIIKTLVNLCLIRRILLFGLAQRVNRKPKAAAASLEKALPTGRQVRVDL